MIGFSFRPWVSRYKHIFLLVTQFFFLSLLAQCMSISLSHCHSVERNKKRGIEQIAIAKWTVEMTTEIVHIWCSLFFIVVKRASQLLLHRNFKVLKFDGLHANIQQTLRFTFNIYSTNKSFYVLILFTGHWGLEICKKSKLRSDLISRY